jgi:hypothetical protein
MLIYGVAVFGQPASKSNEIVHQLEAAFLARDLGRVTSSLPTGITVVIEHSLIPPPKGRVTKTFKSWAAVERWLQSKERNEGLPPGEYMPHREVRKGSFTTPACFEYDNMGISHNSWYLSRIEFVQRGTTLFVSRLVIYDGD